MALGDVHEPDAVTPEEGDAVLDQQVLARGLPVFPMGEISETPGVAITVTLMEKDWKATIREGTQFTTGAMIKLAGSILLDVAGCAVSAGIGCLIDVGGWIIEGIASLFDPTSTYIEVDDPDDVMGDGVWVTTRHDAIFKTMDDGAYGFEFEIPAPTYITCLGEPCTPDVSIPSRMMANIHMCLHREGLAADQIVAACANPEPVLPWPMVPPGGP